MLRSNFTGDTTASSSKTRREAEEELLLHLFDDDLGKRTRPRAWSLGGS